MAGRIGTSELTIADLAAVQSKAWSARRKWYNIGLQLGLKADDLDCIHGPDDDSFREMLGEWLRQESIEKTWDKVIKALRSETVNYGTLAKSIATQLQDESATNRIDHDPTDHSALAVQKPKQRGFMCPCGRCSIEQLFESGYCPPSILNNYPFLDTESLTDDEEEVLIYKLNEETKSILRDFSDLIDHMNKSFKEQAPDIRSSILSCAPHCSGILKGKNTINDIIDVLLENGYLSFYNYDIAKHIIEQQSIDRPLELEIYETKFYQFCKRSVFEVPQGIFRNPPGGKILAFKVTNEMAKSDFNADRPLPSTLRKISSEVLKLTLEDTIMIRGRIATSLELEKKWSLVFLRASKGCVELNFSISTLLFQELKPRLNVTEATELNRKTGIASLEASGIHLLCGPPGKPEVSEVTNDSVTLKWSKPEYTGLHPPTGYRIYYRSTTDQSDKWMMSTEGPVESLVVRTPSTDKGSFIVQAINEIGPGVMSEQMIITLTEHGIPSSLVSCYSTRMRNGKAIGSVCLSAQPCVHA
jgi:hypothetical protein